VFNYSDSDYFGDYFVENLNFVIYFVKIIKDFVDKLADLIVELAIKIMFKMDHL